MRESNVSPLGAFIIDTPGDVAIALLPEGDHMAFDLVPDPASIVFSMAPDFEAPSDLDADNIYEITFRLTDAVGAERIQRVDIEVLDVPVENPSNNSATIVAEFNPPNGFPSIDSELDPLLAPETVSPV